MAASDVALKSTDDVRENATPKASDKEKDCSEAKSAVAVAAESVADRKEPVADEAKSEKKSKQTKSKKKKTQKADVKPPETEKKKPQKSEPAPAATPAPSSEDLGIWLKSIRMGKYLELFVENEIDVDVLPELTDADLKELEIPLGSRRRLLKAVEQTEDLRAEVAMAVNTMTGVQVSGKKKTPSKK